MICVHSWFLASKNCNFSRILFPRKFSLNLSLFFRSFFFSLSSFFLFLSLSVSFRLEVSRKRKEKTFFKRRTTRYSLRIIFRSFYCFSSFSWNLWIQFFSRVITIKIVKFFLFFSLFSFKRIEEEGKRKKGRKLSVCLLQFFWNWHLIQKYMSISNSVKWYFLSFLSLPLLSFLSTLHFIHWKNPLFSLARN